MIDLCYQNNKACVFSAADWETLRKQYRIVGSFLGSTQVTPALPLVLLPEEVCLLVNKQLARIIHYPHLQDLPTEHDISEYSAIQNHLLQAEQDIYKENRKCDLEKIIDKIVEGKMKKSNATTNVKTREEILEEELNKSCEVTNETMVWPILYESVKSTQGTPTEVPLAEILQQTTPTKCAVYADLWEKGYYITPGLKFGGDFLVYSGDPAIFHAIFIIRCIEEPSSNNHTSEIVTFGRLGTSVKKRAVLASLINGSVMYITLNWLET
ncbi:hypothetical protein ILUMI_25221 [Ignelater luminosus]|uniref:tRNA-splicing endonuclease subunit Sen34 n=1 Tax=Ignelater luminosus TaxID=2038154 RepID=A0A8K0C515_IGNLU|nr:hypothetical protein ILUMI_25221 [Ignelater luminosus]